MIVNFYKKNKKFVADNFLIIFNLLIGFIVSILVPKIVIQNEGAEIYGIYAFILGFGGIFSFSDLGVQPGLIKTLASSLAKKDTLTVTIILNKVFKLMMSVWLVMMLTSIFVTFFSFKYINSHSLLALILFGVASILTLLSDVMVSLLRTGGIVTYTYVLKIFYYLIYIFLVYGYYFFYSPDKSILPICFIQLIASLPFFFIIKKKLNSLFPANIPIALFGKNSSKTTESDNIWKESWQLSLPERYNRIIQLTISFFERPLLLLYSGVLIITSYDLLMRLTLFISAIPSALSQPLLAMLSYDHVRKKEERLYSGTSKYMNYLVVFLSFVGFLIALVCWKFFHEKLFSVHSELPLWFAILYFSANSLNVMTAPLVSQFIIAGNTRVLKHKAIIESMGLITGVLLTIYTANGLVFLIARNAFLIVAAAYFLVQYRIGKINEVLAFN